MPERKYDALHDVEEVEIDIGGSNGATPDVYHALKSLLGPERVAHIVDLGGTIQITTAPSSADIASKRNRDLLDQFGKTLAERSARFERTLNDWLR